jgi:general secretion pathway protein G
MEKDMRAHRGFTLVEVLIVVIILGILAAIVVPQFSTASSDAKLSALKTNLQTIRGQIQLYKVQHADAWPTAASFTNQMTLSSKEDGTTAAVGTSGYTLGPYLQSIPTNPYSNTSTVGATAVGTTAWYYDETTGTFRANNAAGYTSY